MSRLINWSRSVYLAGIALALVLVIPTSWFPFQLAKVAVFAAFLLVAIILFFAGKGAEKLSRPGLYAALAVALLPLAYLLSTCFSIDRAIALTGYSIETDTVVFTALCALAFFVSFLFFKSLRSVRLLLGVLFAALILAALFQWVAIVFGTHAIPIQALSDRSVNLIGKWNDLGLMVGLLGVLLMVWVELLPLSLLRRIVAGIFGAGLLVLLGVIQFTLVWWMILGFAIAIGFLRLFSSATWKHNIPFFAGAAAVVSILFLLFGTTLNAGLTTVFPVTSLEVRPAYSTTMQIVSAARGGSLLHTALGTGPGTFGEEWLANKPAEVNQTDFWNMDFNVGFSIILTALLSVGLLGVLAWFVPLVLVLAALARTTRVADLNLQERIAAVSLGAGSLFLWGAIIFYVPSQNIILLAFALSGAAWSYLWSLGREHESAAPTGIKKFVPIGIAIIVLLVAVGASVIIVRRTIAEGFTQQGTAVLGNGDADGALADAARAESIEKNADDLRLAVQAGSAKLQQIASVSGTPTDAMKTQFQTVLQQTIANGQASITLTKNDYRAYLALAQVYDFLASLKITGAYESAQVAYGDAVALNPSDPEIWLALARLESAQGNQQLTNKFLTQALTLKSNYTDAILLVVQLDVANKDIKGATQAAQIAAQTAPGVGSIWFELGLLYYSANDTADAIPALEKAIALIPNYANAQYFLGLSYYAQNRPADAIAEFQSLAASNPGNTEVSGILANMQAGKPPFTGATPPANTPPQTRATAPISE
jgi:tetratricopeptide (TPR) repeat protein